MGTATLRPDGVETSAGWTIGGGAASHNVATSDDNVATYSDGTGATTLQQLHLRLGTFALPALSQIRSITPRIKASDADLKELYWQALQHGFFAGGAVGTPANSTTLTAVAVTYIGAAAGRTKPDGTTWTQADIDALGVYIRKLNTGADPRIYEVYVDVVYNEAPIATVTTPADPTTDTTKPFVTWAYSDPESDAQERYYVKIFSAAQYGAGGFDPETSAATWSSGEKFGSATNIQVGVDLPNATYRAYVKVSDVNSLGRYGTWSNKQFTVNVASPPVPTFAPTAQANSVFGPRVRLDITRGVAVPATTYFVIEKSDDAGATWSYVRGASRILNSPDGNTFTVYDYEAIPGVRRYYRARAVGTVSSLDIASANTNLQSTSVDSAYWWLKDPLDPTVNIQIEFDYEDPVFSTKEEQGVFEPVGRSGYVVVSGVIRKTRFSLTAVFTTDAAYAGFKAIREKQHVLLLQRGYTNEQWYVRMGQDVSVKELGHDSTYKRVTIPFIEVDAPPIS